MNKLKDIIRILLNPGCWFQVDLYSPDWDAELNRLLDQHEFTYETGGSEVVRLNETRIWVGSLLSIPVFSPFGIGAHVRPKRTTMLRAVDKLEKDPYRRITMNQSKNP